jgi:hypothetical protein
MLSCTCADVIAGCAWLQGQLLQQWQREACRLAGAGLCRCHHVTAKQNGGNGLRLNRGWFGIALIVQGFQQGF